MQPPSSIATTAVYLEVVRFTDLYNSGMAGMIGIHESVYGDIKNSDMHQTFLDLWNDVRYHFGMYSEAQFEITDSFPSDEHTPEEHEHLRNVISVCTANARSTQRFVESRDAGRRLLGTRQDTQQAASSSSSSRPHAGFQ